MLELIILAAFLASVVVVVSLAAALARVGPRRD
jgi:hypothetical protein